MRKSSNKKIDITPKNEVKQMFRDWFKKRNEAGQVMTKQDVINNVIKKLPYGRRKKFEKEYKKLQKAKKSGNE